MKRDGTRVTHPQAGDPPFFVCVFAPDHLELVKGPAAGAGARTSTTSPRRCGRPGAATRARRTRRRSRSATRCSAGCGPRAAGPDSLHVWDRELARHGVELMDAPPRAGRRAGRARSRSARAELGLPAPAALDYRPRSAARTAEELEAELRERLDADLERGFTMHGPHRDDLRRCAPTRATCAATARRASSGWACSRCCWPSATCSRACAPRSPVMLLDDVLSELDPDRRERLLQTLAGPRADADLDRRRSAPCPTACEAARAAGAARRRPGDEQDRAAEIA